MGARALVVRVAMAALAVAGTASCASTVSGHGSPGSGTGSAGSTTSPDFPSQSAAASRSAAGVSTSASAPSSTPPPSPSYKVVTVQGTNTGRTITARLYAADSILDCAAHAYGSIVAFLRKHACHVTHRILATTDLGARTVVVSAISTSFAGTASDPYGVTAQFIKLEQSDGTGSINDLFREGHTVAGIADHIPQHEVFQVIGQDDGATIFDAWYAQGSTSDSDKALKNLELELFLTPLTSG